MRFSKKHRRKSPNGIRLKHDAGFLYRQTVVLARAPLIVQSLSFRKILEERFEVSGECGDSKELLTGDFSLLVCGVDDVLNHVLVLRPDQTQWNSTDSSRCCLFSKSTWLV
jgi:ABC-type uncharacterized transport system permease subunit